METYLHEHLQLWSLNVIQLCREKETPTGAQFAVRLRNERLENELLKVHVRLGYRQKVKAALRRGKGKGKRKTLRIAEAWHVSQAAANSMPTAYRKVSRA